MGALPKRLLGSTGNSRGALAVLAGALHDLGGGNGTPLRTHLCILGSPQAFRSGPYHTDPIGRPLHEPVWCQTTVAAPTASVATIKKLAIRASVIWLRTGSSLRSGRPTIVP